MTEQPASIEASQSGQPEAPEPFAFDLDSDGAPTSLETKVFEAIGAASMCWDTLRGAGIFHSDRAKKIAEALLSEIIKDRFVVKS